MRNSLLSFVLFFVGVSIFPVWVQADGVKTGQDGSQKVWSTFVRGGAIYQSDADLDEGGSYSVGRLNIQAGHGYSWDRRTSVSLAFSYSNDDYSFSRNGEEGIPGLKPWETVHSFSLSAPVRLGMTDEWSGFFIPSLRSTGESGADFGNTLTGGVLAGAAYRFGKRLTLGPGIGVVGQLADSASFFPVLIINWKITDRLSLETGRGLAATLGPGLSLNYRASQQWKFAVGGRYEKLRFRLDKNGTIPDGIGEDTAIPIFFNCTYSFSQRAALSFVGGVELESELQVEDEDGNRLIKESSDPAVFGGITFNFRM